MRVEQFERAKQIEKLKNGYLSIIKDLNIVIKAVEKQKEDGRNKVYIEAHGWDGTCPALKNIPFEPNLFLELLKDHEDKYYLMIAELDKEFYIL